MTRETKNDMDADYLNWATAQISDSRMERPLKPSSAEQVSWVLQSGLGAMQVNTAGL